MKKNNLKKYFLLGLFVSLFILLPLVDLSEVHGNVGQREIPATNFEGGVDPDGGKTNDSNALFKNPIQYNSIAGLVYALMTALIRLGWIVVVLALIYVGFSFVMASGKPDKIKDARNAFLYTIIGGVILLGSMAISQVVCNTAQTFDPGIQCTISF